MADEQVIVILTDVTNIKEFEKQGQVLRSMFFSSVAHELRTPLNSMIPILRLVITLLQKDNISKPKLIELCNIALNGSSHLQHVVEDALDISRLENN